MKNLLFLALMAFAFISCDKLEEPEILGTFTHTPEGCDLGTSPMYNCSRFVTLFGGGVADVLYGGDIVSRTSYQIKGQKIEIKKNDQFGLELTFKLQDDGSLIEEGDKSIWLRQE
ncbi:hypothetical protein [Algoriphagus terrigena]|uniref:hypothetical protein n=1 Tax=Algoriphagus terrigena TaxID=344884 RepID=UPI0003FB2920|nr:hypothetical protein [Algoriphagus terrigena]